MLSNKSASYRKSSYGLDIISSLRTALGWILYISVFLELLFFPDLVNLAGCGLALLCWWIFSSVFFKRSIILRHPFAFLMFLSMFLYRYIPLIATLTEGKPISYGFEVPYQTFFFETILFLVSGFSFYLSCIYRSNRSNNFIQRQLYKLGFFQINVSALWYMGGIGLLAHLYIFATGTADYGDVGGKALAGLLYFIYAPIILLFPNLLKLKDDVPHNQKIVWVYLVFVVLLSLAANSRQALIAPFVTVALLYFLQILIKNIPLGRIVSLPKIILLYIVSLSTVNLVSDISIAMLANRGIRDDVDKWELFERTWETLQDRELMQNIRNTIDEQKEEKIYSYWDGWTESYIDNFMINRYGNMRISDQTLYYANQVGFANDDMQNNFLRKVIATYPTNILALIGIEIDKRELEYSQGDFLYSLATGASNALGGRRVTSHVGDGLATWGLSYFFFQFILFFLVFRLLDCLVYYKRKSIIYSPYALMSIFSFIGMFRNANGCLGEVGYVLRGFWQDSFTYIFVLFLICFLLTGRFSTFLKD